MIRLRLGLLPLLCGLAATAGCSLIWPEPPPLFPVELCLESDPQAQLYRGKATSLYVRVYPLNLTDAFSSVEMTQLLADPPPQIAGAAGTPQSRILSPGSTDRMTLDATEGRTFAFLGVVAGYYELQGVAKKIIKVEELRTPTCYTIEFGPSGITGGAPKPERDD